jgi:hypothetical protein
MPNFLVLEIYSLLLSGDDERVGEIIFSMRALLKMTTTTMASTSSLV